MCRYTASLTHAKSGDSPDPFFIRTEGESTAIPCVSKHCACLNTHGQNGEIPHAETLPFLDFARGENGLLQALNSP